MRNRHFNRESPGDERYGELVCMDCGAHSAIPSAKTLRRCGTCGSVRTYYTKPPAPKLKATYGIAWGRASFYVLNEWTVLLKGGAQ